jgi:hypothetical protein
MLALHMPQTLSLAAEIAFDLISSGSLDDEQRERVIMLGLCAAHNMLEFNSPGSERALPIWSALARAWSDDQNVQTALALDFPAAGKRLDELKIYAPEIDVATVPEAAPIKERVPLPARARPSDEAVFDVEARRWIEPEKAPLLPDIEPPQDEPVVGVLDDAGVAHPDKGAERVLGVEERLHGK